MCRQDNVANLGSGSTVEATYDGSPVSVFCTDGYTPNHQSVRCSDNGTFKEGVVSCNPNPCTPTNVANSNYSALGSIKEKQVIL